MGFILPQQDTECKTNTQFYISTLRYVFLAPNFQLYCFSLVGSWWKWSKWLLMLIYTYDGVNQGLHNKLSVWMEYLNLMVYRMEGIMIYSLAISSWSRACSEVNVAFPNYTNYLIYMGRSHCSYKTIFFLGETNKIPGATVTQPSFTVQERFPVIGFPFQSTSPSPKKLL